MAPCSKCGMMCANPPPIEFCWVRDMYRGTEVPGLYFEGCHWWIANWLALYWTIGNAWLDWSRISVGMLDWRCTGLKLAMDWPIDIGLTDRTGIGRAQRIDGVCRHFKSRCPKCPLLRHFGRSPTVLVPSGLYGSSVWIGSRCIWIGWRLVHMKAWKLSGYLLWLCWEGDD